jgi:hypothetical protein
VLVVSRAAYASLERSYPNSARLVLRNLKRKAENVSAGRTRLGGKGRAVAMLVCVCVAVGAGALFGAHVTGTLTHSWATNVPPNRRCTIVAASGLATLPASPHLPPASPAALPDHMFLCLLVPRSLQAVASEFQGQLKAADLDALWSRFSHLQFGWASTELQARRLPAQPLKPSLPCCCQLVVTVWWGAGVEVFKGWLNTTLQPLRARSRQSSRGSRP